MTKKMCSRLVAAQLRPDKEKVWGHDVEVERELEDVLDWLRCLYSLLTELVGGDKVSVILVLHTQVQEHHFVVALPIPMESENACRLPMLSS